MAKASSAREARPAGVFWIVAYPLYAVFAAMVFLAGQELARPWIAAAPRAVSPDDPNWKEKFPARVEAVQKALVESGLPLSPSREREQGSGALRWTHRFYDLTVAADDRTEVEVKLEGLRAVDAGVTLTTESAFGGSQVLVGVDGLLTHTLRLYWAEEAERPRVSLIVAALGDDLRVARQVIDVDAPLAVCVSPFRPFSAQVAELARMFDRDVFLQWSADQGGGNFAAALSSVPGAVGVAFNPFEDQPEEIVAAVNGRKLLHLRIGGPLESADGATRIQSFALSRGEPAKVRADLIQQARRSGRAIGVVDAGEQDVNEVRALVAQWREAKLDLVPLSALTMPRADGAAPQTPLAQASAAAE
jgi:hypothetical protein